MAKRTTWREVEAAIVDFSWARAEYERGNLSMSDLQLQVRTLKRTIRAYAKAQRQPRPVSDKRPGSRSPYDCSQPVTARGQREGR